MKPELYDRIKAYNFSIGTNIQSSELSQINMIGLDDLTLCDGGVHRSQLLALELSLHHDIPAVCLHGGLWLIESTLKGSDNWAKTKLTNLLTSFTYVTSVIPDKECFQKYPVSYKLLGRKIQNFVCAENNSTALIHRLDMKK